ncbi:MAG: FadR/GntR family transcriptional regulator [Pseudomonadota bacterium]
MAEKRLYQKIARQILEMIESGAYPTGTRLPGERELAEMLGVSRVVIREAEISLEALGHVEIKVGSGVYVKRLEQEDLSRLPKVSAFELTQTRLLFESESAALAATEITEDQIAVLEQTIERMETSAQDSDEADEADRVFHMTIAKASGNTANYFIMENLWRMRVELPDVREMYAAVCEEDSYSRVDEHAAILDALKERNPDKARKAMRAHFSRLIENLLVASEQHAIEEARRRSHANREKYLKSALAG